MIRINFYISTTEEQFQTISNDQNGNLIKYIRLKLINYKLILFIKFII